MTTGVCARDYMTRDVITFAPDTDIHAAIRILVEERISGAPVVDRNGTIAGLLSTRDCLRVAFSASYHKDLGGPVADYMSGNVQTVEAAMEIIDVAELFVTSRYRRFPVTENSSLVGLISRYDVLKALEELW